MPIHLTGDSGHLRQILTNLAVNAIKFTETGEIFVCCSLEKTIGGAVSLHFSVSDTGTGIPKDKLKSVFEAFYKLNSLKNSEGTGLGLTISKRLCEAMGGRIWAESEPGKGSVFHFTARFRCQKPEKAKKAWKLLEGTRAMIIDESRKSRLALREILLSFGIESFEAERCGDAIQEATGNDAYGLIFLDDKLAGKEIQALEKLNAKESIKIILVVRKGQKCSIKACAAKIAAYIQKPFKLSQISGSLARIMKGEVHLTPSMRSPAAVSSECRADADESLKILLAEDNLPSSTLIKRFLQKKGHSVTIAVNGREVLDLIKIFRFDLIIMDVQMPEIDGFEATRRIRDQERFTGEHVPIIASTAYAMKGDQGRCFDAGMDAYVSKPINFAELLRVIKKIRREHSGRINGIPFHDGDNSASRAVPYGGISAPDQDFQSGEVLNLFLDDYPFQAEIIWKAISTQDPVGLRKATCSLEGSITNLLVPGINDLVKELQNSAETNDFETSRQVLDNIESRVKEFCEIQNIQRLPQATPDYTVFTTHSSQEKS